MGYVRKKTIKISFGAGHEFAGLEVRMRTVSIGRLIELMPTVDAFETIVERLATAPAGDERQRVQQDARDLFAQMHELFASWNVTDEDGGAVPLTLDELMATDMRLVNTVIRAWSDHIGGVVEAPLEQPSPGGVPFPEASIPMDPLSASPPR